MVEHPSSCGNCGAPLYAQWWDAAANGYRCQRCGAMTPGAPPPPASRTVRFGCAGVAFLIGILAALFIVPFRGFGSECATCWQIPAFVAVVSVAAGLVLLFAGGRR
jgi:hypothetical protein